jgi:nucleoside-diphosphate-sugar epimerase
MRIVVTGARGHLGMPTVAYCRQMGADVLGVDVNGRPGPGEYTHFLNADLTDLGQVYDVLEGADAVIHLAAIAAQRVYPSAKTFFTNLGMTWNILEASARLGVKRVVLASSIQVNHTITPRTPIRYQYLPLDEDHPVSPQDDYGLSKFVGEICANTFARHWGLSVVSFRFPWITNHQDFEGLPSSDPNAPFAALFTYIHILDAARACYLAATADLPPNTHTVLFAAARDSSLDLPTLDYVRQYFPEAEIRPGLEGYGSLLNCARAEKLIGFVPEYSINRQSA